ncbi:MAG: response regulator [Desulfobacterales bacterium]|nr:response regulator [Desulfobacterales bacterium]MDJ0883026.1 response regulator [Desulfobacterales bacterium]MDJ0887337.1 response regulator [Desulfobacterales bacterium]
MIRKVLFVDDDLEMLQALQEGLEKYRETFNVVLSKDGLDAVAELKKQPISLVVTDLKMPRMDGFSLLSQIMENYPDIPVIIITGYSTPEMKRLAQEGGAVGYISKPFLIEDLARQIMKTLRKESDGGTLHSVSSGMFLQLMEMEERTCTIRLVDKVSANGGVLFFHEGELLDARVGQTKGLQAAYQIFSWEEVTLSIQNDCPQIENNINSDLQPIILEAMRIKDESQTEADGEPAPPGEGDAGEQGDDAETTIIGQIKNTLRTKVGDRCGLEDIYQDESMVGLLAPMAAFGRTCQFGGLKIVYFDSGEASDTIVLNADNPTVITVNPKCPRDKIIQVLGEAF